jgi:hypothetical protein
MKTKIVIIIFLFLLQSCYKDLGNYSYESINEISIDLGNDGFVEHYISDTLNIKPSLTFSDGKEGDISFIWYCDNNEISRDSVLVYPVKSLTGKRPYIKVKVINNKDQSTFLNGFFVDIIPDYMTGWIVLSKKGGRSIISYINQNSYNVYTDFYKMIAQSELGPNAIEIKEHWPFEAMTIGNILVIRNEEDGNIEIDGINLSPLYKTNDFFLAKTVPSDFRPKGEFYMWDYSFILDDNRNLYQRKYQNKALFQSGVYANKPMFIPNGVKFDKGWDGPWLSGLTLFYDQTKGCLFVGSDFGSVLPLSFSNISQGMPGDYTFIDNMNKKLVHIGNVKQGRYTSLYYFIYKDNSGEYRVQKVQLVHLGTLCNAIHMGEKKFGDGHINDNSVFCQLERKSDYIFFSGGVNNSILYLYEHTTSKLSEYYSFNSPIKTICADLSSSSNNKLMIGLENGDLYFLGITYQHMTNPSTRFLNKIELAQGPIVSTFYKCGYQYTQF